MIKTIKKIALSVLVAKFAFLGLANSNINTSYAAEEELSVKYKEQKEQLSKAIADRAVVVSTDAYSLYASADAKAAYEKAVADGQAILEKGDNSTFEELAVATSKINQAKAVIWKDVDRIIKIEQLKVSIQENKITVRSAKFLLKNAPNTVAKVKPILLENIRKCEEAIKKGEDLLARV